MQTLSPTIKFKVLKNFLGINTENSVSLITGLKINLSCLILTSHTILLVLLFTIPKTVPLFKE